MVGGHEREFLFPDYNPSCAEFQCQLFVSVLVWTCMHVCVKEGEREEEREEIFIKYFFRL